MLKDNLAPTLPFQVLLHTKLGIVPRIGSNSVLEGIYTRGREAVSVGMSVGSADTQRYAHSSCTRPIVRRPGTLAFRGRKSS